MKKVIAIAIVVLVLAFSGSAYALALYDMTGTDYEVLAVSGTLGIEGIDSFWALQEGTSYDWFYDLAFHVYGGPSAIESHYGPPGTFIRYASHEGTVQCTKFEYEFGSDNLLYIEFDLKGDESSIINHRIAVSGPDIRYGQYIQWHNPAQYFFYVYPVTQIAEPHPVPEPSVMLLLMSGLIGVAAFRKRFKML